jgi:thiamine transporter ThiT
MTSLKINKMVGMAILLALIVALQIVATFIKFGSFSITLALTPIVVGAAMYGATAGAVFGGAFGIVVLAACIGGADIGGNILWVANPALTAVLCITKGAAAGFCAGLIYSAVSKKNIYAGVISAAVICPIVNTGIFIAAMSLFYSETLIAWAAGENLIYYALIGLTGVNFLLEFGINLVLSPAVVRIINALKNQRG